MDHNPIHLSKQTIKRLVADGEFELLFQALQDDSDALRRVMAPGLLEPVVLLSDQLSVDFQ